MCTAITFTAGDSYFGRNLDLEYSYNETVTVTPRNYPFRFRAAPALEHHHAIIGMAFVVEGYPLYYDAMNEHGLAMAGLNFPNNAVYYESAKGKDNITPFEFIPWVLGQCATVTEARALLERINLLNMPFSKELPLSPLHWIIADKKEAITVEAMAEWMKVHDNPYGVMTNNPPFDFMKQYMATYRHLTAAPSENRFGNVDLPTYCQGMGAMGLPGDYSSPSRFVKAAYVKLNALSDGGEDENIGQFFRMLGAVEMPKGCVRLRNGLNDITVYSACMNLNKGIYYYTTYTNRAISAIDLRKENLNSATVNSYPLLTHQRVEYQN